jgi:hypothetical protein
MEKENGIEIPMETGEEAPQKVESEVPNEEKRNFLRIASYNIN